jgi:hypothetical protein
LSTPEIVPTRRGPWRWGTAALVVAGLVAFALFAVVAGLSRSAASEEELSPATVTALHGGLHKLTLSQRAVERVGIVTKPVQTQVAGGRARLVVPYSSIVYDAQGNSWIYTATTPVSFVRHRVVVDRVSAGRAILSRGPRIGTKVVGVGAAELFGTEFEFDEE